MAPSLQIEVKLPPCGSVQELQLQQLQLVLRVGLVNDYSDTDLE